MQSFPQFPFDGPTAASGFVVVPDEEEEELDEVEDAPLLVPLPELEDAVTAPPSASVPVFQS